MLCEMYELVLFAKFLMFLRICRSNVAFTSALKKLYLEGKTISINGFDLKKENEIVKFNSRTENKTLNWEVVVL